MKSGTFIGIVMGLGMMGMGMVGGASSLSEPIDTGGLIFLFGLLILIISLQKHD